jgi:signal transduction histidine kinase
VNVGFERHHSALIFASAITVASFVGATVYTQNRLARLDALSSTIETNAVPSVEHLSRAAVRLTRLSQLLNDIAKPGRQRESAVEPARQELDALDKDLAEYWQLTPLAGEREFSVALRADVASALQQVRSIVDADGPTRSGIDPAEWSNADAALDRAVRSVVATLEFDVRQSEAMARDVRSVRGGTLRMTIILDLVATAIALFAVVVAYRASRRHDQLLDEHAALLSSRVAELDWFAGRVAHDVLSPLGTVAAALPLLAQSCDAKGRTYIERSQRALQRVQQLVAGLLMFARSGARPDPSSRCAVDDVLATIAADGSETAAEHGIDLLVEPAGPVEVPCSLGVLTSIVQNLVSNAIKYMGNRPVRRVVVRAKPVRSTLRLEVEDTGPGIPPELQRTIFEPFVRGSNTEPSGTGLGLATVKRLIESHGGTVGVESRVGTGSLFWVELPLAAPVDGVVVHSPVVPQHPHHV